MSWSFSGANRLFTIDANGTPLVTVLTLVGGTSGNSGLTTFTQDITAALSPYSGPITLTLNLFVPENLTGPAGIMVDNISLTVQFTGTE